MLEGKAVYWHGAIYAIIEAASPGQAFRVAHSDPFRNARSGGIRVLGQLDKAGEERTLWRIEALYR